MTAAADRLQKTMSDAGLDDASLAAAVGMHSTMIYRLRRGERNLTVRTARLLAVPLGVSPDWLLTGAGEQQTQAAVKPNGTPAPSVTFEGLVAQVERYLQAGGWQAAALRHLLAQYAPAPEQRAIEPPGEDSAEPFPERERHVRGRR